ncbi:MAG: TonB-dependent receptor [Myxococcaceae bacterium]
MKKLIALLLAVPSVALAAGEVNGTVSGYALDDTGTPLAEIAVTLSGPAMQQPMVKVTGSTGRFEFPLVPPGEGYVLESRTEPFAPFKKTGLTVRLGKTTKEDVILKLLEGGEETIEVVGKRNPILNPDSATTGAVITAEKAAATPVFTQVQALPQMVAGVGPGNTPVSRGGLARYGKFYVDGMDTTDVSDGSITAPVNFYAVENFEIITGGMDAQYNALGMIENLVTKSGSNRFTYDASVLLSPAQINAKSQIVSRQPALVSTLVSSDSRQAETSFYSPILNVGGPIVKDRLWFYLSTQLNLSHRETPINASENRPQDTITMLGRLKLTWQPSNRDRFALALNLDRNTINNSISSATVSADAESKLARGGYFVILNYDRTLSDNVLFRMSAGTTWRDSITQPVSDGISHTDTNANLTQFGAPRRSASEDGNLLLEKKQRFQVDPTLLFTLGDHQLKTGLQVGYLRGTFSSAVVGNRRFLDRSGVCNPDDPATFSACNTRVDFYNADGEQAAQVNDASALTTGLFLQDRWLISRRLTVIGGVRFDMGHLYGDNNAFLGRLFGIGPRVSATLDLTGNATTLLKAQYGRSNDIGDVFIAQQGNAALVAVESTFNSMSSSFPECTPAGGPTGCTVRGGASGVQFAGNQTPPSVDEVSLGLHHDLTNGMVVGIDGTFRRYSNMWINEETNRIWDASGTRILGYANGEARTINTVRTSPNAYRDYKGVDLWVQGQSGPWDVLANYTLAFNNGTVGSYFDNYGQNPRMTGLFDGPTSNDNRHTLKGNINYRFAFGLDFGVRIQYRTGTPGWMNFVNPGAPGETYYRSRRGTGYTLESSGVPNFNNPGNISELRNPDQAIFDLQARYDLGTALHLKETKLEIMVQLFNALNLQSPTSYDDRWAPRNSTYGAVSGRLSPFQAQLGLRVRN